MQIISVSQLQQYICKTRYKIYVQRRNKYADTCWHIANSCAAHDTKFYSATIICFFSVQISAGVRPCMKNPRLPLISNISRTDTKLKWFSSRLAFDFAQSIEAMCYVENEDVLWAAPTGDAPITSRWSKSLLPTKVCLMLDVLRYVCNGSK